MQEQQPDEEICDGDPDAVLGRVRDIRRKWAVQEDEALAYRLQDEEIAQHYNSNRTRNAIVREDAPRAREAQRQEELQALEERLRHLSILQKQAEEDGRLAKLLASKDSEASKAKKLQQQQQHQQHVPVPAISPNNGHSISRHEKPSSPISPNLSPQDLLHHHVTSEVITSANLKRTQSPLLGAASAAGGPLPQPVKLADEPGPSRVLCYNNNNGARRQQETFVEDEDFNEEDLRKFQEDRDAALARKLQEEMDRSEKDKQLAVEAQDRELAKMIHDKERARYRRAKEKARMKAEAAAAAAGTEGETPTEGTEAIRAASRNSSSSERSRSVMSGDGLVMMPMSPPKIPEKQRSPMGDGDHIGFRANPKPLPPHPSALHIPEFNGGSLGLPPPLQHHHQIQHPIEQYHHRLPSDPVPPYMPIHGYNRNSPKRSK